MAKVRFKTIIRGLVENDAGEFLLAQRAHDDEIYPSHRSIPGGKTEVENAELTRDIFEKTVIRELHEEVGITVDSPKYLCSYQVHTYGEHKLYVVFLLQHTGGEPRALEETANVRFVSLEEAKELTLVPQVLSVLERVNNT